MTNGLILSELLENCMDLVKHQSIATRLRFLKRLEIIFRLQFSRTCCRTAILNFESTLNIKNRRSITITRVLLALLLLHGDIQLNSGPNWNHHPKDSLFCLLQNVRSLKANYYDTSTNSVLNKLSCLRNIVYGNDIDVIALTETWLSDQVGNHEILPVGYNIFRRDRSGKRGGVLLAIKDSIPTESSEFSSYSLEIVSIVIKSSFKNVMLAVCYRPPNSSSPEFLPELNRFLKYVADSNFRDAILVGDFNFPNIGWINASGFSNTGTEIRFIDCLQTYSYSQLVNTFTRGNSLLHLICTTNEHLIDNVDVSDDTGISLFSDHKALTFDLKLKLYPKVFCRRSAYDYSKGDFDGLVNSLERIPLVDIVISESDVNVAWDKWKDTFLAAVDSFVPKVFRERLFTPPYISRDVLHAIKKKESLRRKAKAKNSPELLAKFRKVRQHIKCWINAKKKEYLSNLAESVFTNSKPFWRYFKSSTPDIMKFNESKLSTAEDKANAFNTYFASVFNRDTSEQIPSNPTSPLGNTLNELCVSASEVKSLLSKLSPSKATGPDGIPSIFLKRCATVIAPSLAALFNLSLNQGKVPSEWKMANVVPIPKKNDPHDVTNYRPVSLLSIVSKVLEHVIFANVSNFVKSYLYDLQHGFRPNRSCVTQLLCVLHDLGRALDAGKEIDAIYLDFSKAFDSVSHRKLLFKLSCFGISVSLLVLLGDNVRDREQRVVIEGFYSYFRDVTSGVPQEA